MSLSPGADAQEKPVRRPNGPSFPVEDDESDGDESRGLTARRRANHDQAQVPDLFDESVENTINQMRSDHGPDNTEPATRPSLPAESRELFVAEEEQVDVYLSANNITNVKTEPGSDDDLMVIQKADASPEAQKHWSLPQRFIIDLTDVPEKEPVIKTEPAIKKEPVDHVNPILPAVSSQFDIEALEARSRELQLKAVHGGMSKAELSEMLSANTQLGQARSLAHTNGNATTFTSNVLPDSDNHQPASGHANEKKPKQKRKPPVKTAAEYWARREENDREREARGLKRKGTYSNSSLRKTQKTKTSKSTESDSYEEENERQIDALLQTRDAIQERVERGDLPPAPRITATKRKDQLKQMREAAPDYFHPKVLNEQKSELQEATKSWGHRAVRCKNGGWEVRGLNSPMLHHQLVVGAWMLGRELKELRLLPKGGILADAMGLGKTIEALSCIVGNQAPESLKETGKGATLVICPSGQMIRQWMSEVKKHCNKTFAKNIVHFKAGNKMDIDLLASFNIVFASYHQLRHSSPTAKAREAKQKQLTDPEKYREWLEEESGELHRIDWYRVVLDEAHCIKNHKTHSAFAAYELQAKYRWAVSGTPLINSPDEIYSYLKFIRCSATNDFDDYHREYRASQNAESNYARLMDEVMYRRTQGDFFLGQPILDLPAPHPSHQYLTLSAEEMVIFRMMERCFRQKLNLDMKVGITDIQVQCYLVMLLRLRQVATHPFLLEGMMAEHFSMEDLLITKKKLKALKGRATIYSQIGPWTQRHQILSPRTREVIEEDEKRRQDQLRDHRSQNLESRYSRNHGSYNQGATQENENRDTTRTSDDVMVVCDDTDEVNSQDEVDEDEDGMVPHNYRATGDEHHVNNNDRPLAVDHDEPPISENEEPPLQPFGQSEFGLSFDMTKQLEYLERLKELEAAVCFHCKSEPPLDPLKAHCGCIFCNRCLMARFGQKKCPRCRKTIGVPKPFNLDGNEADEDLESDAGTNVKDKDYIQGNDYAKFQPFEDEGKNKKSNKFLRISDKQPDLPVTSSAKMTALKETVLRWQAEAPDDKIIIFSQFTVVMKVIGRMLESEGICFAYLSGKQNTDQRNKAVDEFQNGDKVKILIASLRAGGQCLNLTRGNRVILMELWWNHAVEQQAFARVYRIGQIKETHFVRFIVNTPIEQRMLQMQVSKILSIDAALQDDKARKPKITLVDIASLLGRVVTNSDGLMHVVSDYDDEDEDDEDDLRSDAEEEEEDLEDLVVPDGVIEYEDDEEDD
ncbi:Putative helicase, Zinc finger, RING-type, Zinc finger, RING/FYVE/PHD-type [Colletotrichum destructivum]|uniref:Helicase, Zinc finger, RING-type, Zinc finger, RING/FYVE/PHD-type n=1 Tax=Colletotrichum destructivum TaxID=34406 RepID=A0AAX4IRY1_9PEZI|nr:Putative helicase, Zinc finger, RING-type, Zinc finger, RING/FYVE/PHD-type [Colletotrichum destructivum]